MEVFVARQPIFDLKKQVAFYELLFRSNEKNYYNGYDGNEATLNVIANSFTLIGLNTLTNGKKAFINFTERLIKEEIPRLLPSDKIAIEILEDIKLSPEFLDCCQKLKSLGYVLVLDDFVFAEDYRPLISLADYIKIDFLSTTGVERKEVMRKCQNKNIKFIAEKVETIEDFNEAVNLGYSYF